MPTTRTHTVIESPFDPLTLVAGGDELCGLYMVQQRHLPELVTFGDPEPSNPVLVETERQLKEYFAGQRKEFDLPIRFFGTPFQQLVWTALSEIPYGETVSYGQLADRLGRPTASRAVGLANGKNPIGIIVPCHRVVGATGDLTGYGGGLDRKRRLLDFEGEEDALF